MQSQRQKLWEIFISFVLHIIRPTIAFFGLVFLWNFVFPLMFWNGFTEGAFGYFDFIEITIFSTLFLTIYIIVYGIKFYQFQSHIQALLTLLVFNTVGIMLTVLGYATLVSNLRSLTFYNHIPYSLNFIFACVMWIFLVIIGFLLAHKPSFAFKIKSKEEGNDSVKDTGSTNEPVKTEVLPGRTDGQEKQAKPEIIGVPASNTVVLAPIVPATNSSLLIDNSGSNLKPVEEPKVKVLVESKPEVSVQPQAGSDPNIGIILKSVEFVANSGIGRSGFRTVERIGGKFAFPDRRGPQPEHGDIWTVEISSINPKGTVYFVKCLSRESTLKERESQENSVDNSNNQGYAQGQ